MTLTPILGLKKPDASDAVKRADFNFNWDLLDNHGHAMDKLSGVLPVEKGGTGGSTAAAARAAIGADNAANLTTGTMSADRLPIVPVAKGGTGASDAATARANIGAAPNTSATPTADGLMSSADKSKLDGVAANANNYTHPNTGVSAGSYLKVTVNQQGHVTAGSNDPMAVTEGGTGATDAAGARSNIGAAAVSHASATGDNGKASATAYGHAMASSAAPLAPGTANAGTDNGKFAREGHIHPAQVDVTGKAGSADKLATARRINGSLFDGTADISFGAFNPSPIAASTDLNTVQNPGFYKCDQNATVATLSNTPTTYAFFMIVGTHAGVFQQIIEFVTGSPKVYMRNLYQSTWGAWYRVYTTADAPTSVSGNAGTATKWVAARNVSITGGATATAVALDGTADIALNVTALDMSKATAGTLPIARGGTGGADAAAARTALGITPANIGAAATSHNQDASTITSGTLPVARGGTGQTTAAGIRNSLGLGNTTGAVPVANGGTGATTAAAALTNLGIFYAATLPTSGVEGQICLVPIA